MSTGKRCVATVLAGALALAAASCAGWAGSRQIRFDDPYINQLPARRAAGWLGMARRFRAYARVDRAFELEKEGQLDAAAAQLAPYLEKDPEDLRVRAYYLGLLARLDEPARVVEEADRILAIQPAYVPALLARARARAGQGRLGPAIQDLLAASRSPMVRPEDRTAALADAARYRLVQAGELERDGRWREAAVLYASALDLPLTAGQQARALEGRDRSTTAQARAVRAEPGRTPRKAGRPAAAEASRGEATAGPPERPTGQEPTDARLALAAAHEAAGRVDEAMELYREIAAAETASSSARLHALERLAVLHTGRGEHRRAGARMMELFRATGAGSWARRAGDSYVVAEAWSEAAAAYGAARQVGALPGPEGARRLAVALYEAGEHGRSADVLATIPPDRRTSRDLRYLAAAAQEGGQVDRAATFYRSALGRAVTRADSATILGSIGYLLLQREDSAAVIALGEALRLRPDPALRLDLARAQLRLDRPDDALATLEGAGLAAAMAEPVEAATDTATRARALERADLLTEVQLARDDTAGALKALAAAAQLEPTAQRLNRLAYLHRQTGDDRAAAEEFRRAYEAEPSALQAARVAYAYRRIGAEVKAAAWFRRSIDAAKSAPAEAATVDLDAIRQEEALLTDRFAVSAYASVRQHGGVAGLPPAGVGQVAVASQGGVEARVLPLVQGVSWGREVDVLARLFWAFDDGVRIDPHSYQGQLGIRYRPRKLPGVALGLERWIGIGDAARDVWATRLQVSRVLGNPYPGVDSGSAGYAALYGDAAYLFDHAGTHTFYAEGRPGVAVPLGRHTVLLPHGVAAAYYQSPGGIGQSHIEAGPGLGLRLRFAREGDHTRDFWSLELMTEYRWGQFPESWNAGGGSYDGLVFTLVVLY